MAMGSDSGAGAAAAGGGGPDTSDGTEATLRVHGEDRELEARLSAELTAYNIAATGADDQADI